MSVKAIKDEKEGLGPYPLPSGQALSKISLNEGQKVEGGDSQDNSPKKGRAICHKYHDNGILRMFNVTARASETYGTHIKVPVAQEHETPVGSCKWERRKKVGRLSYLPVAC